VAEFPFPIDKLCKDLVRTLAVFLEVVLDFECTPISSRLVTGTAVVGVTLILLPTFYCGVLF
jgi:hypothetical protein